MAKSKFTQDVLLDVGTLHKTCPRCKNRKPIEAFRKQLVQRKHGTKYVRNSWCSECASEHNRQSRKANPERSRLWDMHSHCMRYGLTLEQFRQREAFQGGVCSICHKPETQKHGRSRRIMRLAIDHDHKTGQVRSLLCKKCNGVLGLVDDDPALLRAAADYIERHRKLHESTL